MVHSPDLSDEDEQWAEDVFYNEVAFFFNSLRKDLLNGDTVESILKRMVFNESDELR